MNDFDTDRKEERREQLRAKELELLEAQQVADLRAVLAMPAGRRFLWRVIDDLGGATSKSFSGETTHHTAYLEGRRAVGLELMQEAQRVDDSAYVQMLSEELNARRERAARLEQGDDEA